MTKLLADSAYTAPHQAMLVRHLVQRLVSKAFRGDIIAIKEVANRVEGRLRNNGTLNSAKRRHTDRAISDS
jgi:hypothetical protein